jgi:uncharacterized alpha-E superfamily protein
LLILDDTNPRSINWILEQLDLEIHHLPNTAKEIDTFSQIINACRLQAIDNEDITAYSKKLSDAGKKLSNEISSHYFAHIKEQRFTS